ncbi:hypothetical protein K431DRAFT_302157 [Polychaeton citri CBS 116435]|uniref:Uncharacterized protein n=1 Tax=Polychaeton citri CBS 116435 TaxID=1314669 RepID=A0A9P4Q955_9PEZI|nr:hypothetical protein K431DRAFT_302157 [Polychaeton citri CBS 116435]
MQKYPQLRLDASQSQADIDPYIRIKVREAISKRKLLRTEKITEDLQLKIEETLYKGAQGMFRWVELQLQYLCTIRVRAVPLDRLGRLPPQLKEIYQDLYDRSMEALGEKQAFITKRMFSWLLVAQRQLRINELIQLIYQSNVPDIALETVLDIYFNLVTLDSEQDQFRFSHLSVREFLEQRMDEFSIPKLHNLAASVCLSLVMRGGIYSGKDYAPRYWLVHTEILTCNGTDIESVEQVKKFLCTPSSGFIQWHDSLLTSVAGTDDSQRSKVEQRLLENFDPIPYG